MRHVIYRAHNPLNMSHFFGNMFVNFTILYYRLTLNLVIDLNLKKKT